MFGSKSCNRFCRWPTKSSGTAFISCHISDGDVIMLLMLFMRAVYRLVNILIYIINFYAKG